MAGATQFKYAIIGGGMAGLSTAWFLAERVPAQEICLFTHQPKISSATASYAAAGMLAPVHELDFTELPLLHFARHSLELHRRWAKIFSGASYQFNGTLEVALTPDDVPFLERQFRFHRQENLAVKWLETNALQDLLPGLSARVPAGIFAPDDGRVNPRKLTHSIREALAGKGVRITEVAAPVEVSALSQAGATLTAGVESVRSEQVILANGAGSVPGAPPPPEKIFPVRGQMLRLREETPGSLAYPLRIRNRAYGNAYIVPRDGSLVLGSTSEEMGHRSYLTGGGVLDILRKCYAAYPEIYELDLQESWVGFRPASLSRKPVIARHPQLPVFWVNGLYRHGILLGPAVGQAAAALVLEGKAFSLDEFSAKKSSP